MPEKYLWLTRSYGIYMFCNKIDHAVNNTPLVNVAALKTAAANKWPQLIQQRMLGTFHITQAFVVVCVELLRPSGRSLLWKPPPDVTSHLRCHTRCHVTPQMSHFSPAHISATVAPIHSKFCTLTPWLPMSNLHPFQGSPELQGPPGDPPKQCNDQYRDNIIPYQLRLDYPLGWVILGDVMMMSQGG